MCCILINLYLCFILSLTILGHHNHGADVHNDMERRGNNYGSVVDTEAESGESTRYVK